ncbi:putative cation-transporting ATPase 13A3 [Nymphon striatum]|nr:putative cation-transporting ATPase 13A3 [Nymphon striatum]
MIGLVRLFFRRSKFPLSCLIVYNTLETNCCLLNANSCIFYIISYVSVLWIYIPFRLPYLLGLGFGPCLMCIGYKESPVKKFFFAGGTLLTFGFIRLVTYWKPGWKVKLTKTPCSLEVCDTVVLKERFNWEKNPSLPYSKSMLINTPIPRFEVKPSRLSCKDDTQKYFEYKRVRFFWNPSTASFINLSGFEPKCTELLENYQGISDEEQVLRKRIYGPNVIEYQVRSYGKLAIDEVLHPFFIFQLFSIILWCNDEYYYYAGCIFFISCISIGTSLYETKKQDQTLHDMIASQAVSKVMVSRRGSEPKMLLASKVVPGDIIIIPEQGCVMCCDVVLLTGNCIVNESMLTGESVPVTKTPLTAQNENELYSPEIHRRHTLFCGTEIIQTRYYGQNQVMAVVVRTGFLTSKGELIRSIMFPKPINFYRDAMRFILILFGISLIGMSFSLIILRGLDIITIVVPPSLPAALTLGIVYAQQRLKKNGIFCTSPQRINQAGKSKVMCFDKTGTLTEDGLDLYAVLPVENQEFSNIVRDPSTLPATDTVVAAMASCHSLTLINRILTGDPLDIKMFEATKWELEEPGEDASRFDLLMPTVVHPPVKFNHFSATIETSILSIISYEIGIVRQFTFSSSLQRMSVVVRRLGADHMDVYVKGAPEKIASLCHLKTVPADFQSILHNYSREGFRVLALAYKSLSTKVTWHQVQRIKREAVESELTFLGLLLMQNSLKLETKSVIHILHEANLRTVMITGDNMLTAVSVARECKMISSNSNIIYVKAHPGESDYPPVIEYQKENCENEFHEQELNPNNELSQSLIMNIQNNEDTTFVLDGKTFGILRSEFSDLYQKILVKGKVFGRMAPDQKTQLIEDLQNLGYTVGMCGDGANDCGALKAAHVGISLSDAEASVAAPFTSKIQNITCVPKLIKEGRCALVTAFGIFKYMALYSMVQFISVLILYTRGCVLSDMMFLYIDLVIITTVAVSMSMTGPYKKLDAKRPLSNLIGIQTMFVKKKVLKTDRALSWETTVIFYISSFQYIILAYVFSKGPPYRQPIYKNCEFI